MPIYSLTPNIRISPDEIVDQLRLTFPTIIADKKLADEYLRKLHVRALLAKDLLNDGLSRRLAESIFICIGKSYYCILNIEGENSIEFIVKPDDHIIIAGDWTGADVPDAINKIANSIINGCEIRDVT